MTREKEAAIPVGIFLTLSEQQVPKLSLGSPRHPLTG